MADSIARASDEIINANSNNKYPLKIWENSGANVNHLVNNMIAACAMEIACCPLKTNKSIDPNEHVNKN